jgi:hypothetical protein
MYVNRNLYIYIYKFVVHEHASEDLQNKCKEALKFIISQCVHLPALRFIYIFVDICMSVCICV